MTEKIRLYAVRNESGEWLSIDSGQGYTCVRWTASGDPVYAKHWDIVEATRLAREHRGAVVTFVPEAELTELERALDQAKARIRELEQRQSGKP